MGPVCDPRSVARFTNAIRNFQLTLLLGREGKLNKNSTAEGALGARTGGCAGGRGPGQPALRIR